MKIIILFLVFLLFPLCITKLTYILQNKCKSSKIVMFIDALSIIFFTVYGFSGFYLQSIINAAMSSNGTINYMLIVYLRNIIGFICGFIYSLFVNYRQMGKYLKEWKIVEQKENFVILLFLLELVLIFCFNKLCHIG